MKRIPHTRVLMPSVSMTSDIVLDPQGVTLFQADPRLAFLRLVRQDAIDFAHELIAYYQEVPADAED